MPLQYLNPGSMHRNPAYSQGIVIPAGARIVVVGGQNAVNAQGEIVGKGDVTAQTIQALDNLETVLAAAGASLKTLIRVGIFFRDDADLRAGFAAWMQRAGGLEHPPTVTGIKVAGLAHPDFLIEIEATALVP
jgi:enamine deaminase RidA (YjgF/YER057c/UK114 family)